MTCLAIRNMHDNILLLVIFSNFQSNFRLENYVEVYVFIKKVKLLLFWREFQHSNHKPSSFRISQAIMAIDYNFRGMDEITSPSRLVQAFTPLHFS